MDHNTINRTRIRGLASLETLQEHKMEFDNKIRNTHQFEVRFPLEVQETVLGLVRTWNSVRRIAYSQLRSLAPPSRKDFSNSFPALNFRQQLNVRHVRDAYADAEWVVSSQKEQLLYRIESFKTKLAKYRSFFPNINKLHKQRTYTKKMQTLRRKIAELERQYETESFLPAIFGGRDLFRRLSRTNKRDDPEKHARLKAEFVFYRQRQIFSRGERSRQGNENLRIIQGSKIVEKDRKTYPFIEMDLDAYYIAVRIPYLGIAKKTEKIIPKSHWVYGKLSRKDIATFDWSLLQDIAYSVRLRRKIYGLTSKSKIKNKNKSQLKFKNPDVNHDSYEIHVSLHEPLPALQYDFSNGSVGVDVNPPCTGLAFVSSDGNLTGRKTINHPELLYSSANKRAHRIHEIAHEIVDVAQHQQKGIVIENLFFHQQASHNTKWNRYASNFPYRQMLDAIKRCAAKRGVPIRHVYPAYTSMIGKHKYMAHYQLTIHEAAALVIGRRGLGIKKERISRLFKDWLKNIKPLDNGKPYSTASQFTNRDLWKFLNRVVANPLSSQIGIVPPRNASLTPVSNVITKSVSNSTSGMNYTEQVRGNTHHKIENPDPPG